MQRIAIAALLAGAVAVPPSLAEPLSLEPRRYAQFEAPRAANVYGPPPHPARTVHPPQPAASRGDVDLGGGFIEFLFGGGRAMTPPPRPPAEVATRHAALPSHLETTRPAIDPQFLRQVVPYHGTERPGTIIVDTQQRFLFLVQENGTALRYGIGVGRPGFTWAGVKTVSAKRQWPDWVPPPEMLKREPHLPRFMPGGPDNPLGARALYLGSSLYRIHGSNEPWTIGQAVSSGCIRMRNDDVIDLYDRVRIGSRVVVI